MEQIFVERKNLIVGEIYIATSNDGNRGNIFCWGGTDALYYTGGRKIRENFYNVPGGGFESCTYCMATPFEKAWLLEMKRTGKFIPENVFIPETINLHYEIY